MTNFKKHIAVLVAVLHIWTFSVPSAFADGPVITGADGTVYSQSNGDVTEVNVLGGQEYTCAGCDIAEGHSLNINILNEAGFADAAARAIFNITDGAASNWQGNLNLLGTAAFINEFGFNIAETFTATVQGGALLSSLGIDQAQFLAGITAELAQGLADPAAIINNGTFNIAPGSYLALVANAIQNNGNIAAEGGMAVLAAGEQVTMDISGNGIISVEVKEGTKADVYDFEGNKISDAISNTGTIQANGGLVHLTAEAAEGVFDSIVNHTGVIEANTLREENGVIILDGGSEGIVDVTGDLYATGDDVGETGGTIKVLGDKVGIFGDAIIEASGYDGGGEVLVGGNYLGLGEERNATATFVSSDATIKADAILEGDGGKIVVWSDEYTFIESGATLSARGGELSGDGGFIETSSAGELQVAGVNVDAGAANGAAGTWLLDPSNVDVGLAATSNGSFDAGNPNTFTPTGNNSKVLNTDIEASLNAGTSVTIKTGTTAASGTQAGNIRLLNGVTISKTAGGDAILRFEAAASIIMQAGSSIVSTVGELAVQFISGLNGSGNIDINGSITTNGGDVTFDAQAGDVRFLNTLADIATGGGAFIATAFNNFNMSNAGSSITTADGIIDIDATNGDVTVAGALSSGAGDVTLDTVGDDVIVRNTINTTGGNVTINAVDRVLFDNVNSDVTTTTGNVDINADSDASGAGNFDGQNSGSKITTTDGNVTIDGARVRVDGQTETGAGDVTFTASTDDVEIRNSITTGGGKVTATAQVDVLMNTANADVSTTGGDFEVNTTTGDFNMSDMGSSVTTAGGAIDVNATDDAFVRGTFSSGAGNVTIDATGDDVELSNTINTTGGGVTINAADRVLFNNTNSDITTTTGNVEINADADSSGTGNFDGQNGGSKITTTDGNVTITGAIVDVDGQTETGAGDVTLTADVGEARIGNMITTGGGNVTATAQTNVLMNTSMSDVSTSGGNFTANGTTGDFNMSDAGSSITTAGGAVDIDGGDDVLVRGTISSGAGNVNLDAAGDDVEVSNTIDTTGGDVTINAVDRVFFNNVNSDVTTTTGNVTITADSDSSGAGNFDGQNSGSKITTTDGNVTVQGVRVDMDGQTETGAGNVELTATGSEVEISNTVTTAGGNVTINAANGIDFNNTNSDITTAGGSFTANADTDADTSGNFNMANTGSSIDTTGGAGAIDAQGNVVNLRTVNAGTGVADFEATNGNVTLNANFTSAGTSKFTASGNVNQAAGTLVTPSLEFNAGGTVTLADANNDIDTAAGTSNGTLQINDVDDLTIGVVGGETGLISNNNLIDLDTGGNLTINEQVNAGTGNVDIDANGIVSSVDDAAADIVANNIDITATQVGASAVDVTSSGTLTVDTSAANGKVEVDSIGDLTINTINAGTGDVTVDSTGFVRDAAGNDTTTDVTGNVVTVLGATGIGQTIDDALNLAASKVAVSTTAGDAFITGATSLVFTNISNVVGNLVAKALGGNIEGDAQTLTVSGNANFDAGTEDIFLFSGTNNFGSITANGDEIAFDEDSDMDLAGVTATTSLALQSAGNITDSGTVVAPNLSVLNGTGSVVLDEAANDFDTVGVSAGGAIQINDVDELTVQGVPSKINSIPASLTVTGIFTTNNDSIDIDTGGDLTTTAGGTINAGTGNVDIDAGGAVRDVAGNDTATDITGNEVDINATAIGTSADDALNLDATEASVTTTAGDAFITGATDLTFGNTSNVVGNLVAKALGGNVTETAGTNLTVTGNANFDAGANDIFLFDGTATNNFGSLTLNGDEIAIREASSMDIAGATATTSLLLTSGGDITDSGTIVAPNLQVFNIVAPSTSVILDDANNDFDTAGIGANGVITLNDVDDLTIQKVNANHGAGTLGVNGLATTGTNAISVTTGGNLTINNGPTGIRAGAVGGGDVTLNVGGTLSGIDDTTADIRGATIDITANQVGASAVDVTAGTILNVDTSASNGKIEVDSIGALPVGVVNAGTGNVTLSVETANDDMTDANDVTPDNPGVLNITGDVVTLNTNGGDIGAVGNVIEIASTTTNTNTNGGSVNLGCVGDCSLGQHNVGTGIFRLTSTGAITDGNDTVTGEFATPTAGVWNITAGGVVLQAANGIGVDGNAIETRLSNFGGAAGDGRLEADGGAGGVFVANAAQTGFGLTLGGIGDLPQAILAQTGIQIFSGSPLTIIADVIDNGGGNILLAALGNAATDDVSIGADVTASGGNGNIDIYAGDTVRFHLAGSDVTAAGTGNINIIGGEDFTDMTIDQDGSAGGDVSMNAANSSIGAADGNILIDAAQGVQRLENVASATGNVTVLARNGEITSKTDDGVADVSGATVNLTANNGNIELDGGGGALEVTVTTALNADSSTNNGNIVIDSIGNVPVGLVTAGTGDVTLNSTAAIGSVTPDGAVADIVGSTVNLVAGTSIGGMGAVDVTATTALNADTTATNGDISLNSVGDAKVGLITTGSTTAGTVNLTSTGAIDSVTHDGVADIVAKTINLVASVGGIGVTSVLEFTAGGATINADTTADNSNIFLDSIGDAIVGLITAGTGNVTLNSTTKIDSANDDGVADIVGSTINLDADAGGIGTTSAVEFTASTAINADTAADNANISLDSIGDAKVGLITTGSTTAGTVNLNSTGAIDSVADDGVADIVAKTINLDANLGGIGQNSILEFSAGGATINADTTADGSAITMDSLGDAVVGLITTGGAGDVTLTSTGAIDSATDDGVADIVGDTINLTAAVGGIGQTSDLDVTATTQLNANTAADGSGINIDSIGALPVGLVDAAATGNVVLEVETANDNMTDANDVTPDAPGVLNVQGNDITLNTNGGDVGAATNKLEVNPAGVLNGATNGGNFHVACTGSCALGLINLGTGLFDFLAAGALTDGNDLVNGERVATGMNNLIAGGAHIVTGSGIGTSTNWFEMRLADPNGVAGDGVFQGDGGTGGVFISNTGGNGTDPNSGLAIGGVDAAFGLGGVLSLTDGILAQGGIHVDSNSPLDVNADVSETGGNDIVMSANGNTDNDDLTINNNVTISITGGSGNLTLASGDQLHFRNGAVASNEDGDVNILAGEDFTNGTAGAETDGNANADLRMDNLSAIRSQEGNINIRSQRDSKIAEVNANSDAAGARGDVTIAADTNLNGTGHIEDRNGVATNIIGQDLLMTAGSGIGVDSPTVDDALETDVVNVTLTNRTSGNVNVDEVAAGMNLNIRGADQQGPGNMTIRTLDGHLTVVSAGSGGTGVSATSGETLLEANGATGDLRINNTVTSTTGKINLDSTGRDVTAGADGDVTATGGAEIEVNAFRDLDMTNGTIFNANGGGNGTATGGALGVGIDIDAGRNVDLGSVQTTSTASTSNGDANDAVDINAGGAITDGGDADDDIIANGVNAQTTLRSVLGTGDGNEIDTQVDRLDTTNTTSGDINIVEVDAGGDLNVVRADQQGTTTDDDIFLFTTNGSLTVLGAAVGGIGVKAIDGLTRLFSRDSDNSGADHLNVNNTIQTGDGKVELESQNDVTSDANGDITTGDTTQKAGATGAEIQVLAEDNIIMADGSVFNANGGGNGTAKGGDLGNGIDFDATTGDITLGSVQTTSTAATSRGDAFDAVDLDAPLGEVKDGGDTDDDIIANAGQTDILTSSGVGHMNPIETQIDRLEIFNTDDRNIEIRETTGAGNNELNIVRIRQAAPTGRIDIQTNDGNLTVLSETDVTDIAAPFTGVAGLAGQIFLRANGDSNDDDLVLNNNISATTGKVNVDSSSRDVLANFTSFDNSGSIATDAEIESDAYRHITMQDGVIWNAMGGGTGGESGAVGSGIDMDALMGNITLSSVQTTSDADHAVVISARNTAAGTGQIIDGGDTDTDIVTAAGTVVGTDITPGSGGGMLLRAGNGIGSRGTGVAASIAANGPANNFATDALDTMGGRIAAQTVGGDIQVQNTGSLEVTTLTDNDAPAGQGNPAGSPAFAGTGAIGAGTVVGLTIDDPSLTDPASIIFVTAASPIAVNSAITNNDGGNVTLYALGNTAADFMDVNQNILTQNGNGDVRLVAGGDVTLAQNVSVQTTNAAGASTGDVIIGAGFDASTRGVGGAATQDEAVATLLGPLGLGNLRFITPDNPGANLVMQSDPTETTQATALTDQGDIIAMAGNQIEIGLLNADGNTDGIRGDVTTNSINGSTFDSPTVFTVTPQALDVIADTLTMNSGALIGTFANPVEVDAPIIDTLSVQSQFIDSIVTSIVNLTSTAGSVFFSSLGNIILGTAFAPTGRVSLEAGGSILSQGGTDVRVIADDRIDLSAQGTVGTPTDPINTLFTNPAGTLFIAANSAINNLSANVTSNLDPTSITILNAVGLVLFNGSFLVGGDNFGELVSSLFGTLFFNVLPNNNAGLSQIDGTGADFPGFFNLSDFATSPSIEIGTGALDQIDIGQLFGLGVPTTEEEEEDVPTTTVPVPTDTVPPTEEETEETTTTTPTTQTGQTGQEDVPPTTVPIPEDAVPTGELGTTDNVQV